MGNSKLVSLTNGQRWTLTLLNVLLYKSVGMPIFIKIPDRINIKTTTKYGTIAAV